MNEKKDDIEEILKEIGKAWQETKEHFGDEFPFEEELDFKIIIKKDLERMKKNANTI